MTIKQLNVVWGRWSLTARPPETTNGRVRRRRIRWGLVALMVAILAGLYRLGVAVGAATFLLRFADAIRAATGSPVLVSIAAALVVGVIVAIGAARHR